MDKIFLIGHRGVGKTSLMRAFKNKHPHFECIDLDERIESDHGRTIEDYFLHQEEELFRQNEIISLNKICKSRGPFVVAIGAGCHLKQAAFPSESMVLWVRRQTDSTGRIFLAAERPALTPHEDPLFEWQEKYPQRQELYQEVAQAQLFIPESMTAKEDHLGRYLFEKIHVPENFYCTLLPKENVEVCLAGSFGLELRNDIWSELDIHKILKQIPFQRKLILAVRRFNTLTLDFIRNFDRFKYPNLKIDWDIALAEELGELPNFKPGDIISEHANTLDRLLQWKKSYNNVLVYKFAPEVASIKEALKWQVMLSKDFSLSAFFPRSEDLDLSWMRMLLSNKNEFNFFRFSEGSAKEQTLWFDLRLQAPRGFYGILGESVSHSLTPDVHKSFFVDKAVYPVRISVPEEQLTESLWDQLKWFGLRFLAVTSPYKTQAYHWTEERFKNKDLKVFASANTVVMSEDLSESTNTDWDGLQDFFDQHIDPQSPVVVFGGGSMLGMLEKLLPKAYFLSARTSDLRSDSEALRREFQGIKEAQLVWAAGDRGQWPELNMKIHKVLDLDYKENSKAKNWVYRQNKSKAEKITYVNGLDFFKTQALAQQKFWGSYDI